MAFDMSALLASVNDDTSIQALGDRQTDVASVWACMPRRQPLESVEGSLTQIILSARTEAEAEVEEIQSKLAWQIEESVELVDRLSLMEKPTEDNLPGEDMLDNLQQRVKEAEKAENQSNRPGVLPCDHCGALIAGDLSHFRCQVCSTRGFNICGPCYLSGKHCLVPEHQLQPGVGVRDTTDIFAFIETPFIEERREERVPIAVLPKDDSTAQVLDPPIQETLNRYLEIMMSANLLGTDTLHALSLYDCLVQAFPDSPFAGILSSWAKVCHLLADDATFLSFRSSLTTIQRSSIRILFEWWTASIQDSEIMAEEMSLLILRAMHERTIDTETLASQLRSPTAKSSVYHAKMLSLLIREFSPIIHDGQYLAQIRSNAAIQACAQRIGYLHYHRDALPVWLEERSRDTAEDVVKAVEAWAGKIDLHTRLWRVMAKHGLPDAPEVVAAIESAFGLTFETLMAFTKGLFVTNHLCCDQRLGAVKLTPTLAPMAWFSWNETHGAFPRFLWHRRSCRTVEIKDESACPPYIAISHTWGRWRKRGCSLTLPNVPWEVPEIAEDGPFQTQDLPEILRKVPGSTEYLWFDLVCIPQDESDPYYGPLKAEEIRKQAGIFSNAVNSMAWFGTIPNWDSLSWVITQIGPRTAEHPHTTDVSKVMSLQRLFHLGMIPKFPLMKQENPKVNEGAGEKEQVDVLSIIHEWFTSLWTLQEVFMRPDMWLCCRDWTPLTLPWPEATPSYHVSFDGLLCLLQSHLSAAVKAKGSLHGDEEQDSDDESQPDVFSWRTLDPDSGGIQAAGGFSPYHGIDRNDRYGHSKSHVCVEVLVYMMSRSGLMHLLSGNPLHVLSIGDRRVCRSGYGEAVMSVLGAVEWHKQHRDSESRLGGRYPIEFIDEVRRKFGSANLFRSAKTDTDFGLVEAVERWEAAETPNIADFESAGTLLPFGRGSRMQISEQIHTMTDVDRFLRLQTLPSTDKWEILENGRVRIRSASILFPADVSGSDAGKAKIAAFIVDAHRDARYFQAITARNTPLIPSDLRVGDIKVWLAEQPYACYAVNFGTSDYHQDSDGSWNSTVDGIILRELQPGFVVKTGEYEAICHNPETASAVDLTVL